MGMFFYPDLNAWYPIRQVSANPAVPGLELAMTPNAVNANGHTVGFVGFGPTHAFWSQAHYMPTLDLGTLAPTNNNANSVAFAININDWVVGFSTKDNVTQTFGFLYNGSRMIDLNTLLTGSAGWVVTSANGINNNGVIAAQATFNGQLHAVALMPRLYPAFTVDACQIGSAER